MTAPLDLDACVENLDTFVKEGNARSCRDIALSAIREALALRTVAEAAEAAINLYGDPDYDDTNDIDGAGERAWSRVAAAVWAWREGQPVPSVAAPTPPDLNLVANEGSEDARLAIAEVARLRPVVEAARRVVYPGGVDEFNGLVAAVSRFNADSPAVPGPEVPW